MSFDTCSPHVTTLRERIAINRSAIAEDEFNALVQRQMTALESAQQLEGGVISHFEAMVALAYKQFQEQLVRWTLGMLCEENISNLLWQSCSLGC